MAKAGLDDVQTPRALRPCRVCRAVDRRRNGECRPCAERIAKAWRAANPEKDAARRAAYAKAHPELMAAAKAKYAKENPEKVRAARAAYDKANAAKIAKHKAAYYRANIEKMKARAAIKRAKNREKISASSAKYARANLDKRRAYTAKRHAARLRALPPWRGEWDVTKANEAIYEGAPQGMHVDHIVPLQGDAVCGLHVPWNLQILPPAENIRKGNRFDQDRFSAQYLSALRA